MKYIALTVAFILELIAFAFFAGFGLTLDIATPMKVILVTALLISLVVFWGLYMAPKAPKKVAVIKYYVFKISIYAVSAYSILVLTTRSYFIAFIIAVLLDELFLFRHNLQS